MYVKIQIYTNKTYFHSLHRGVANSEAGFFIKQFNSMHVYPNKNTYIHAYKNTHIYLYSHIHSKDLQPRQHNSISHLMADSRGTPAQTNLHT